MPDVDSVLTDLRAESADLDALVADRSEADFARATPASGWTVAHQIAHLVWTDRVATISATDPDAFMMLLSGAAEDPGGFVDRGAVENIAPPPELLARWRAGRDELAEALHAASGRLPWFGMTMSPVSMATGRIMETWAHGLDVADALGVNRPPTERLRHVAFLGYRAIGHSFAVNGRPEPTGPVRVELAAPDGGTWAYGPEDAADRVIGPALDFCLLVTQRRHPADLALQASGPVASEWMEIAQAFAGPPGAGRQPSALTKP